MRESGGIGMRVKVGTRQGRKKDGKDKGRLEKKVDRK